MAFYKDVLGLQPDALPEMPMPDGSNMHRLVAGTANCNINANFFLNFLLKM